MAAMQSVVNKKNEAVNLAVDLLALIDEIIPKRQKTIQEIREIAAKLKDIKQDVNIAKVVGCATSVIGGIAGIAGIFLTGGLALPLVVGGGIAAISGTATNIGADIVGNFISKGKLDEAQKVLDADKIISIKIEKKKDELDIVVKELGDQLKRKQDDVFAEIMISSVLTTNGSEEIAKLFSRGIITAFVFQKFGPNVYALGSVAKFATAVEKVSLKGLTRIFGKIFATATAAAMIIWDIIDLVGTSIELSDGSPTEAAEQLFRLTEQLKEGSDNLADVVTQLRSVTCTFEEEIRNDLTTLIEAIAKKDITTDEEIAYVKKLILKHGTNEWKKNMFKYNIATDKNMQIFAQIFYHMKRLLTDHMDAEKKEKDRLKQKRIAITMIGHGSMSLDRLPSCLYYMNEYLKSVTIYQPWGCVIDASVVYGIMMNNININNVEYSGDIFNSYDKDRYDPITWNVLPNTGVGIPTPIFHEMQLNDAALKALAEFFNALPDKPDGLVIAYVRAFNTVELPTAPLYLITSVFALLAEIFQIEIEFRYAACLQSDVRVTQHEIVADTIYFSSDINVIYVGMINKVFFTKSICNWQQKFNAYFNDYPVHLAPLRNEQENGSESEFEDK